MVSIRAHRKHQRHLRNGGIARHVSRFRCPPPSPRPAPGRRGNHSAAPSGAARAAGGRRGRARNPAPPGPRTDGDGGAGGGRDRARVRRRGRAAPAAARAPAPAPRGAAAPHGVRSPHPRSGAGRHSGDRRGPRSRTRRWRSRAHGSHPGDRGASWPAGSLGAAGNTAGALWRRDGVRAENPGVGSSILPLSTIFLRQLHHPPPAVADAAGAVTGSVALARPGSLRTSRSTACHWCSGLRCEYRCVITSVLWPRISLTVYRSTPTMTRRRGRVPQVRGSGVPPAPCGACRAGPCTGCPSRLAFWSAC